MADDNLITPDDLALELAEARDRVGQLVAKCRGTFHTDPRWVSIAATELQTGFMALERAIAQPLGF